MADIASAVIEDKLGFSYPNLKNWLTEEKLVEFANMLILGRGKPQSTW